MEGGMADFTAEVGTVDFMGATEAITVARGGCTVVHHELACSLVGRV